MYFLFVSSGNGEKDVTKCFCCEQVFSDWVINENPGIKHFTRSPACAFVILSKGRKFLQELLLRFRETRVLVSIFPTILMAF